MSSIWMRILRFYGRRVPLARGKGRLAKWLYRRLSIPYVPITAEIAPNIQAELYPWLWPDFCTYTIGSPELYMLAYFHSLLQPDAVVFDVGAYIGIYTFTACSVLTSGQVHTFEPNPLAAQRIQDTLQRNNITQVCFNQCAVGDHIGTVKFTLHASHVQSHIQTTAQANAIEIPIETIDRYCHRQNINKLDILKIDVEGAELLVLRGAKETIQNRSPHLVIELHEKESGEFGYSVAETVQFLHDTGHTLYTLGYGLTTRPQLKPFTDMDKSRQIVIAKPG